MGLTQYIWVKRQKYYLWETYPTWEKAKNEAKRLQKRNRKNKWFIQRVEEGWMFPRQRYALYMSKIIRAGLW